jgi:hypothetical protein
MKKIGLSLFFASAAFLCTFFGQISRTDAANFETYYNRYQYYLGYYNANPNSTTYSIYYLGFAIPNLYYYYAGYYGDYYGFNNDAYGSKSDQHLASNYYSSFTNASYYYNYYAYIGDYYWRTY